MTTRQEKVRAFVWVVAMTGASVAFAEATDKAPAGVPRRPAPVRASVPAPLVEKVTDPARVCMVNDMDMGKAQIPVVVAGRTYYGCCAMCKDRLARDAAARTALDPVSGKTVDKARAVIGKRRDGSVVYFETEANLRKYAASR